MNYQEPNHPMYWLTAIGFVVGFAFTIINPWFILLMALCAYIQFGQREY